MGMLTEIEYEKYNLNRSSTQIIGSGATTVVTTLANPGTGSLFRLWGVNIFACSGTGKLEVTASGGAANDAVFTIWPNANMIYPYNPAVPATIGAGSKLLVVNSAGSACIVTTGYYLIA